MLPRDAKLRDGDGCSQRAPTEVQRSAAMTAEPLMEVGRHSDIDALAILEPRVHARSLWDVALVEVTVRMARSAEHRLPIFAAGHDTQ